MSVKPPELNCKLRFLIMPRDVCVQNLAAIIKVSDSYFGGREICSNLFKEIISPRIIKKLCRHKNLNTIIISIDFVNIMKLFSIWMRIVKLFISLYKLK